MPNSKAQQQQLPVHPHPGTSIHILSGSTHSLRNLNVDRNIVPVLPPKPPYSHVIVWPIFLSRFVELQNVLENFTAQFRSRLLTHSLVECEWLKVSRATNGLLGADVVCIGCGRLVSEECDFAALDIALSMAVEWDERRDLKDKGREVEVDGLMTPLMTPIEPATFSLDFNSPNTSSETSPGSGEERSQTTQQALDLSYLEELKQKLSELFREYEIENWRMERHKKGCNVLEEGGNGSGDRNMVTAYEAPWFDPEDPPWEWDPEDLYQ